MYGHLNDGFVGGIKDRSYAGCVIGSIALRTGGFA